MAAELTRLTHKIAIQLHLVAESCTIRSSHSRRLVRKLLNTPSCTFVSPGTTLPFLCVLWTKYIKWTCNKEVMSVRLHALPFKPFKGFRLNLVHVKNGQFIFFMHETWAFYIIINGSLYIHWYMESNVDVIIVYKFYFKLVSIRSTFNEIRRKGLSMQFSIPHVD